MGTQLEIVDLLNLKPQTAAVPAVPGTLGIQNVNNALKKVDDQGNASDLGGTSVLAGTVIISADATNCDITGIDGETMGGICVNGWIQTPTVSGGAGANVEYYFAPNGVLTNQNTQGDYTSSDGLLFAILATATQRHIRFRLTMPETKTGRARLFIAESLQSNNDARRVVGRWDDSTTPITSFRISARYAASTQYSTGLIAQNVSFANVTSYVSWYALGAR